MIDFGAAHRNGLVVTCRNAEESKSFCEDFMAEFREYDVEIQNGLLGDPWHINHRHSQYRDGCVSYHIIMKDEDVSISWCDYNYYRSISPYRQSEFVAYYTASNSACDLGEIDTEDSIDINSLFGEVMS